MTFSLLISNVHNFLCYLLHTIILLLFLTPVSVSAIEVIDYHNRTVLLTSPAKRIIALSPHIVENIYSAGAGSLLVGTVTYSDYPADAKKIPRVGSFMKASFETIVALKPDVVILWGSGGGGYTLSHLEKLGLTVYVDDPRKLEDIARSIRDIGILSGTQNIAEKAAVHFIDKLSKLRTQYGAKKEVSLFYEVWDEPLQTLNGTHLISDIIQLCGGRNIYSDTKTLAPIISIESVLKRNPDMIVASSIANERPQWINDWQRWPSLTAVKEKNLFFVPPDIIQRHTSRILDGAEILCQYVSTARQRLTGT